MELISEDSASIGSFVTFGFTIWLDKHYHENEIELHFEVITLENSYWLLSGPTKKGFVLRVSM